MADRRKILIANVNQFGYHTDHYSFAERLSEDYDVHYICFDRGRDRVAVADVNVVYLPFPRLRFLRSIYFLAMTLRYIYVERVDILLADYFMLVFFLGLFSKAKKNILDIRSGSLSRNALIRRLGNLSIWVASLPFDQVTVLSDGLADQLMIREYRLLPLGSDILFGGSHNFETLRLLYVGTLNHRNIHETIEGLSLFISNHSHAAVKYDIVGFGGKHEVDEINHTIRNRGLQNVVMYHGRKVRGELKPFFAECNVGVSYMPVVPWYDNQPPTKTFEYILSGMVCLATATSENKRYVNETNGVLCLDSPEAFAEALNEVWQKREDFRSDEIRQTLSDYTWERIVETKLKPLLSTAEP